MKTGFIVSMAVLTVERATELSLEGYEFENYENGYVFISKGGE